MKISSVLLCMCYLFIGGTAWGQDATSSVEFYGKPAGDAPGFFQLQSHFHKYVDEGALAGTIMLLGKGNQIRMDKYGMQNIEACIPMSYNTIFRLASMTKPITSVAVMMLVEEGKLELDDPVERYIPEFKKLRVYKSESEFEKPNRPITIRHLLSHTGGITSGFDPSPAGQMCAQMMREKSPKNLKELVLALTETPLSFQPGEGWVYSYSTDVLAYVIEQVTGQLVEQFFQERIFDPLKMEDTGFLVSKEKIDRFSVLYATGKDGKLEVADAPASSPYTNGAYFPRGNGGLTSTAGDYFRFAQMLLNKGTYDGMKLISAESVELMTRNHLAENLLPISIAGRALEGQGFGLGVGVLVDDPPFGKAGDYYWPGAAFTYFFVNPKNGTVAVFMTQLSDMSKMNLIWEFHDLASRVFDEG